MNMNKVSTLYHLICDYGVGDPAFAEVIQRFKNLDPVGSFNVVSVPAFSTLATGFWISQLSLWNSASNVVIFSNTAPRHDDFCARKGNDGEKFVFIELDNGFKIGAVNAGYSLSFVREHIKFFHKINTLAVGSQFRSRDYFPRAFVETLNGQRDLAEKLDTDIVPEIPNNKIAFIDGYGNIKTTIGDANFRMMSKISTGDKLLIKINGVSREVVYTDGIFEVESGVLTIAPGSSGDPKNRWLEIVLRRGSQNDPSAKDVFHASVEDNIFWEVS